ncbi:hemerythrin domain-containing protein [Bacillus sp. AFS073361]|uniref:hemerythrin domain-containing protein n=1 Tax=Bacillus sp. AFS073361 TaxID=2033511 RepID=UPI0015D499BF|nr:hemerythrin domain-containing protein [Bacillus sp. AFS073361]
MEASNILLSAPLQKLLDEHMLLRADMDLIYEITEDIEYDSGPAVVQLFEELYNRVSAFNFKLKTHSKREEEGLFPMIARHLGENDRTIEEMESEHEKADQHLEDFLTETKQAGLTIDVNAAEWINVYAVQALATLTQHFAKEEKVLFPLAENILSVNEKQDLERLFQV